MVVLLVKLTRLPVLIALYEVIHIFLTVFIKVRCSVWRQRVFKSVPLESGRHIPALLIDVVLIHLAIASPALTWLAFEFLDL